MTERYSRESTPVLLRVHDHGIPLIDVRRKGPLKIFDALAPGAYKIHSEGSLAAGALAQRCPLVSPASDWFAQGYSRRGLAG